MPEETKPNQKEPTANDVKCWNTQDVTKRLKEMFVEMGQKTRIERGQKPAERAVFRKQHGVVYGNFIVNPEIDPQYKIGIFAGKMYDCILRFSSDTAPTAPDLHSTLGLALKLFGIQGKKEFGEGENADFIFQNIDRFFAKDAQQMCQFTTAGVVDRDYGSYIKQHPTLGAILQDMSKEEASCLTATYWAILPFKLGDHNIVKYRLVPDFTEKGVPFDDNDYLSLDLQQRLRNGAATFNFEVQVSTCPKEICVDNAQEVWPEDSYKSFVFGHLTLPQQDICTIGQEELGANLSFNIWRTPNQHKPLGSIALARKEVYAASAKLRHEANGQQTQEPKERSTGFAEKNTDTDICKEDSSNKSKTDLSDKNSDCIVRAGIYPPIGVMRVGNSEHEYFIGPLVDKPEPKEGSGAYRDETGALRRQAAQFRVYGFNAAGEAVQELTTENASITWHCHLANQKASWYQFQLALDIPEAANVPASMLRNIDVKDRKTLIIDGGKQSISGQNVVTGAQFDGKFQSKNVYLGEMRTDAKGRLIMLGGHGKSENINGNLAVTFANNEGWYDDISDGPVTADVIFNGMKLTVDPAWVICAPPDYAPMQKSVRTMWDLMRDVSIKAKILTRPARPSFIKDILPIFERMTNLQWVNAGFAAAFGWGGQFDYTTKEWMKKLSDPSSTNIEMRRTISNNFRRFDVSGAEAPQLWPWMYGDAVNIPSMGSVRQHATLSDLQLEFLDQWAKGDFDADFVDMTNCPHQSAPQNIDDLPVNEQPDMLTKAAMDFCLADAFHPGCEMTWPMRSSGMYMAPFRLKHAPNPSSVNHHYYGPVLNNDILPLAQGPIQGGQVAGGITRWMAIPWQTDTASCRDGYTSKYDPYLPTFWPARVPNNMLSEKRYEQVLNTQLDEKTRQQAFAFRKEWLDDLPLEGKPANYTNQINSMVKYFDKLAVVQKRPGVPNDPNFPAEMQIGTTPSKEQEEALLSAVLSELGDNSKISRQSLLSTAVNHLSQENLLDDHDLLEEAQAHLTALLEQEHEQDSKLVQQIQKLQNLVAAKTHKKAKPNLSHLNTEKTEVGIPEKMTRFSRYFPQ